MSDSLADILEEIAAHGGLLVPCAVEPLATGYAGCFASEVDYLRQELEPFIDPCIPWLFDCLDWARVRGHLGDLQVLALSDGAVLVFRLDELSASIP